MIPQILFRLASVVALVLFVGVATAGAGQSTLHMSGKRTGFSAKHFSAPRVSLHKKKFRKFAKFGHHRFGIRHAGKSGVWPTAKILHGQAYSHRHGDQFRRSGFSGNQIAIVIGAGANSGATSYDTGGVVLEGGNCEAGAYCTLRLGSGSSAPKIISLNTSGRTITCLAGDCAPVN